MRIPPRIPEWMCDKCGKSKQFVLIMAGVLVDGHELTVCERCIATGLGFDPERIEEKRF